MYYIFLFFFFKQKTAYEMRISDWSSDVCSSDLLFGTTGAAAEPIDKGNIADGICRYFGKLVVPDFQAAVGKRRFIGRAEQTSYIVFGRLAFGDFACNRCFALGAETFIAHASTTG